MYRGLFLFCNDDNGHYSNTVKASCSCHLQSNQRPWAYKVTYGTASTNFGVTCNGHGAISKIHGCTVCHVEAITHWSSLNESGWHSCETSITKLFWEHEDSASKHTIEKLLRRSCEFKQCLCFSLRAQVKCWWWADDGLRYNPFPWLCQCSSTYYLGDQRFLIYLDSHDFGAPCHTIVFFSCRCVAKLTENGDHYCVWNMNTF